MKLNDKEKYKTKFIDQNNNKNQLLLNVTQLSVPPPINSLNGFLDFTQIEYYIYFKNENNENNLRETSPFYYANGFFHINPNMIERWKTHNQSLIEKASEGKQPVNPDTIEKINQTVDCIPLINDSRIFSTIFEQKFINVNDETFKINFCTLCEELKNTINTIVIKKKGEIIKTYTKDIDTKTDKNGKILIRTGRKEITPRFNKYANLFQFKFKNAQKIFVFANPVFKIDSNSKLQRGGGRGKLLNQRGGLLPLLVVGVIVEFFVICGAFMYAERTCYYIKSTITEEELLKKINGSNKQKEKQLRKGITVNGIKRIKEYYPIYGTQIIQYRNTSQTGTLTAERLCFLAMTPLYFVLINTGIVAALAALVGALVGAIVTIIGAGVFMVFDYMFSGIYNYYKNTGDEADQFIMTSFLENKYKEFLPPKLIDSLHNNRQIENNESAQLFKPASPLILYKIIF